jgi:hypothetical protein
MSAKIFIMSGLFALSAAGLIIFFLFLIMPQRIKENFKYLILVISGIYLIFQILYFTNIIPPIPLSIKESGIYHSIERINMDNYIFKVTYEPEANRYLFFRDQSDIFHYTEGEKILYSYSAIFSPTDLNMPIYHRWMYFDQTKGSWIEYAKISFNVTGGRDGGYRGYSYIRNFFPGKWRVDVLTERGQILGRRKFTVIKTDSAPSLETTLR